MPCLNEEYSVAICVAKAQEGIRRTGLHGEVIICDNGSADRSVEVAQAAGAYVVHEMRRGYGSAYRRGFEVARGRIIVMGDSDDSYDFTMLPEVLAPLMDGYDYVLGSRFAGHIRKGAMPWTHRYIGNPLLTKLLNALFGLRVSDAHSGFRAFKRDALEEMALRSTGMEFASEIVVRAAQIGLKVAEVPIIYHPRAGESKLRSLRDAWRHVRFLLLHSPDRLLVFPGALLMVLGLVGQMLLAGVADGYLSIISKVLLALIALGGSQLLTLGLVARIYSQASQSRIPQTPSRVLPWLSRKPLFEYGLFAGLIFGVTGLGLVAYQLAIGWRHVASGGLSASGLIFGLLCIALGPAVCFDTFFLSMAFLHQQDAASASSDDAR